MYGLRYFELSVGELIIVNQLLSWCSNWGIIGSWPLYRYTWWSRCQGNDGRINSEESQVPLLEEAAAFSPSGGWADNLVQVQMGRQRTLHLWVQKHVAHTVTLLLYVIYIMLLPVNLQQGDNQPMLLISFSYE